jgi:hypothetical protein
VSGWSYAEGWLPKVIAIVFLGVLVVLFGKKTQEAFEVGPMSIVRLELAPTVIAANRFMEAWKAHRPGDWKARLTNGQQWDTWFICAYAPLCALLCWVAAEHLASRWPIWGRVGFVLALLQLFAGVLDFIENAGMRPTIEAGYARAPWPAIAATASAGKWTLLLAFGVYGSVSLVHRVVMGVAQLPRF